MNICMVYALVHLLRNALHTPLCVCVCMCGRAHVCIRMFVCACVSAFVRVCARVCTCVCD